MSTVNITDFREVSAFMSETDIYAKIKDLVDTEHELRSRTEAGELDPSEERAQLDQLESTRPVLGPAASAARQEGRRTLPDDAEAQSVSQVENYLQ